MQKRLATLGRLIERWPLPGRISCFLLMLAMLWAPLALLIYALGLSTNRTQVASSLVLAALYVVFIAVSWGWGIWVRRWRFPFLKYGFRTDSGFGLRLAASLGCGLGVVLGLFALEVWWGWANFYPQLNLPTVLSGLGVGLGIGLAEEWFFRGWLLSELRTDLTQRAAAVWSALVFAIAHFIKPLPDILATSPQFLGLLLLGIVLAQLRYVFAAPHQPGSLAWPIGFHGGLVWGYYMIDVADLVIPSAQVPDWITGIHGNPLSGALGLSCLVAIWATVTLLGRRRFSRY